MKTPSDRKNSQYINNKYKNSGRNRTKSPARLRYEEDVLNNNSSYSPAGAGWNQLLVSDSEVERMFYSELEQMMSAAASAANSHLSPAASSVSGIAAKAVGKWVAVDKKGRFSVRANLGGGGKSPNATIKDNADDSVFASIIPKMKEHPNFRYTWNAMNNGKGSFAFSNEGLKMMGYSNEPLDAKAQKQIEAAKKQREAEIKAKAERDAQENALYAQAKLKTEQAKELKEAMVREVSKNEFMICFEANQDNPQRSPAYVNRKHPDATERYMQFAKGIVSVTQGYRPIKLAEYGDFDWGDDSKKPSRLELEERFLKVEQSNTYKLAQRLHHYEPQNTLLQQYIASLNGNFQPSIDTTLADKTKPLDNEHMLVPAYRFAENSDNGRLEFAAMQDFYEREDFKFKANRAGSNIMGDFYPAHRGANFPPKTIILVEGVATAMSAAVLNDVDNHPYKDDIWVVSAFTVANIEELAKEFSMRMPHTEIVVYGDNDNKILRNEDKTPKLDENGAYINDQSKGNAGREMLRELWKYSIINPYIAKTKSGNLTFQARRITGALMPIDKLDSGKKESDVNDIDNNYIKQGLNVEQRIEAFKEINADLVKNRKIKQEQFAKYCQNPTNKARLLEELKAAQNTPPKFQRVVKTENGYEAVPADSIPNEDDIKQVAAVTAVEQRQAQAQQVAPIQEQVQSPKVQSPKVQSVQNKEGASPTPESEPYRTASARPKI